MHSSQQKLKNLIARGSTLQKEDARATKADCAQWIQDVRTYNERALKNHPAHKPIHDALFFCNINSILGYLRSVYDDIDFWQDSEDKLKTTSTLKKPVNKGEEKEKMPSVFISHRTEDSAFADMIKDFLVSTNIPSNYIFCSSLPGNNVRHNIQREVKEKLSNSTVNIAVLSKSYYESAYCVNEAGIIWFQEPETPAVLIGLPEIDHTNMLGFLDGNNIFRRLDDLGNISEMYDIIQKAIGVSSASHATITNEGQKLIEKYKKAILHRSNSTKTSKKDVDNKHLTPLEQVKELLKQPEDWVEEDSKYYHNMFPQYTIVIEDELDEHGLSKEGHRMFYHHLQTDTAAYYGTIKIFCNGTQLFSWQSTDLDGHRMTAPCPESEYIPYRSYGDSSICLRYYVIDSLQYLLLRFFEFHIGNANGQEAQIATRNLLEVVLLFDNETAVKSFATYVNRHLGSFDNLVSQQKKYPIYNETEKATEILVKEISAGYALAKMKSDWECSRKKDSK